MFQTHKHPTFISNFKPAKEVHGNDKRLVGDTKVKMTVPNTVLDTLGNDLRASLYRKRTPQEEPPQSELVLEATDGLTALKNPHLDPLSLDEKFPGYQAEFESGLAHNDPIKLKDITLSNFTIEAKDGGSVELTFNMRHPVDGRTSGKLCQLIQEGIELTLIAPSVDDVQQEIAA